LIISYLATLLGTNSLSVLMCRKAVNQSINQPTEYFKTEVIWCATSRRQQQLPTAEVRVGSDYVRPSKCVRNLGIFIESDVTMRTHVTRTVASCFATLRQLCIIRRSVSDPVFQTLIVSLVLSWLDYVNATLAGIPGNQHHS